MRRICVALVTFMSAVGCVGTPDNAPVSAGPEVETVRAWFQQYTAAINAGGVDHWATFVANDAVILPPDEPPIIGMETIRPRYAALFRAYAFDFNGRPEEITVAGPLAIIRASIEETLTPTGGGPPMQFRGAWLLVLRRQSDGVWKLWRNMWSVYPQRPAQPSD
jgi:uncharacterized protein (TIGR02246 family)